MGVRDLHHPNTLPLRPLPLRACADSPAQRRYSVPPRWTPGMLYAKHFPKAADEQDGSSQ
jgi:hypothetical protein